MISHQPHADAFRQHRRLLWGMLYRLTGCAADADDLLQETFVRAMEHPPRGSGDAWRGWLVRVAMNLGRDLLRRRKRRAYVGPWLPSPIETDDETAPPAYEPAVDGVHTTEGRYDLLESVSFAFLLALEALTPQQRAVLVLMDVFDYSVRETSEALGMSPANVKTTHHRARRAMQAYDRERRPPTRALQEQTRTALARFVNAVSGHDVGAVEALLAEGVRAVSDGGGEFFAARVVIAGPRRVARFHWNIGHRRGAGARTEFRMINGFPALVVEFHDDTPGRPSHGQPPRTVLACDLDAAGRITRLYTVLATRKLSAVHWPSVR